MTQSPLSPELRKRLGMMTDEQIAAQDAKHEAIGVRPSLDEIANSRLKAPLTTQPSAASPLPSSESIPSELLPNAHTVGRKPQASSPLRKQFPLFSCSAFVLYLQGVPKSSTLQTFDDLRNLTLAKVFTTPDLLIFRSLLGAGRAQITPPPELAALVSNLGNPSKRLAFTSQLFQDTAEGKAAHIAIVQQLESLGVGLLVAQVLSPRAAKAKLDDYKDLIENYLGSEGYDNCQHYWLSKDGTSASGLSHSAMLDALNEL